MFHRRINCSHVLTATITTISGGCCQGVLFIGLPDATPTEQYVVLREGCHTVGVCPSISMLPNAHCLLCGCTPPNKQTHHLAQRTLPHPLREKLAALKAATQFAAALSTQPPALLQQLRMRSLLGAARCPMCHGTHGSHGAQGNDVSWFRNNSWTSAATAEAQRSMVRANPAAVLGTRSSSGSAANGVVKTASSGSMGNATMSPFQTTMELGGVGPGMPTSPALEPAAPGGIYQTASLDRRRSSGMRRGSVQGGYAAGFGRQGSITSMSSLGMCKRVCLVEVVFGLEEVCLDCAQSVCIHHNTPTPAPTTTTTTGKRQFEDSMLQPVGPASGAPMGAAWRTQSQPMHRRVPSPASASTIPTSTPFIMEDAISLNAMPVAKMRRSSLPVEGGMYGGMDAYSAANMRASMMAAQQQQQQRYMMAQQQQQQYMMAQQMQQQQYMMAQQQQQQMMMMAQQRPDMPAGRWAQMLCTSTFVLFFSCTTGLLWLSLVLSCTSVLSCTPVACLESPHPTPTALSTSHLPSHTHQPTSSQVSGCRANTRGSTRGNTTPPTPQP